MAKRLTLPQNQRIYFNDQIDVLPLPSLVDHQNKSFKWFVDEGLKELLDEVSPIDDYTGTKLSLTFKDYHFENPKIANLRQEKIMLAMKHRY